MRAFVSNARPPQRAKALLVARGIKQRHVAALVGIDEAHLSKILSGVRPTPPGVRRAIAAILGADEDDVFRPETWDVAAMNPTSMRVEKVGELTEVRKRRTKAGGS